MTERSRRRCEAEGGFTVPELAVVMMIFGLVSIMIFNFFDHSTRITARTTNNVQAERDAQLGLRVITQDIRAANPVGDKCATGDYDTCLRFKIARPTTAHPECSTSVTYRLAGGHVVQDLADDSTKCATARSWNGRRVVRAMNTSTQPVFQYFDRVGKAISISAACTSAENDPACPKEARTVRVRLLVDYNTSPGTVTLDLSSVASLRNNR